MIIDLDMILNRLEIVSGGKEKEWSQADDLFLSENLGFMEESEIAKTLGRTIVAVHLRWKRDLNLPAPSKDPRYITGHQIAEVLGVDGHTAVWWIDSGLLPGERLPGKRLIRRVSKADLLEWVLYPDNWVYFHPDRVRDPN
jgi:excisionase family DNA binding protein